MSERTEVQIMADEVQEMLSCIGDIAKAIRNDRAFDGSDLGARLSERELDAMHLGVIAIAKVAHDDLIRLLDLLGVPA